jgi:hypothetical protein
VPLLPPRRPSEDPEAEDPKAEALLEARKATARLRREGAKAERQRARKQGNPDESIIYTPSIGDDL